ncbi:hypothetical protein K501DRAFT_262342 [Backusella circina FSU 941]|nr:hypothetical protein K501DRAFT_262342 [Backusella circina FSU 941]
MQVVSSMAKHKLLGKASKHVNEKRPAYETDPEILAAMEEASKNKKKHWWSSHNKVSTPEIILSKEDQDVLHKVKSRAWRLDQGMTCCGISFGLDPVIGLIPGIGDVITTWMAMRLVRTAATANLPKSLVSHMTMNVMIDFLIGLVPIAGDVLDFFFKCNMRNAALLEEYLILRRRDELRVERGESIGFTRTFQNLTGSRLGKGPTQPPPAVVTGSTSKVMNEKTISPKEKPKIQAVDIESIQPQSVGTGNDSPKKKRFGFF